LLGLTPPPPSAHNPPPPPAGSLLVCFHWHSPPVCYFYACSTCSATRRVCSLTAHFAIAFCQHGAPYRLAR
jgi:hypothetical protein